MVQQKQRTNRKPDWHKPLTWFEPRKCWRKVLNGRQFYLAKGRCKNGPTRQNHAIALAEFLGIRERQSATNGNRRSSNSLPAIGVLMATNYWKSHPVKSAGLSVEIDDRGIANLIEVYLDGKRREAESGQISMKMYAEHRYKLEDFQGFCERIGIRLIGEVDSWALESYRQKQLELVGQRDSDDAGRVGISAATAKKRLDCVRRFFEWAESHELIDRIPKQLNRHFSRVKSSRPRPQFFTVDEVQELFKNATDRTRLYIALALNAGYTQKDIATLTFSMLEDDGITIRRERSKTEAPQVCRLWTVTEELLAKNMKAVTRHDVPILKSETGKLLVYENVNSNGTVIPFDSIRLAFGRVKKKIGMTDNRGFKTFRKTGANAIEKQFKKSPQLRSQYLAHSDRSVGSHYVERHFEELFEATDWLCEHFGLSKLK